MEEAAFPSEPNVPRRASFQAAAAHHMPAATLEDSALLSTLVSAADEHTIKEAIPDEPFLSAETKTIMAALLAEFIGTMFLILVSVGIQVCYSVCIARAICFEFDVQSGFLLYCPSKASKQHAHLIYLKSSKRCFLKTYILIF